MSFLASIVRDARPRSWMRAPAASVEGGGSQPELAAPAGVVAESAARAPAGERPAGPTLTGEPAIDALAATTESAGERSGEARRDSGTDGETSAGVVDPLPPEGGAQSPSQPEAPTGSELSQPVMEEQWHNTGREQAAHKARGESLRVENDGVSFAQPLAPATEIQLGTKENDGFDSESIRPHQSFGLPVPDLPTIGTVSSPSARIPKSPKTTRRDLDSEGSEGSRSELTEQPRRRVRSARPPGTTTPTPDSTQPTIEVAANTAAGEPPTVVAQVEERNPEAIERPPRDAAPAPPSEPAVRWLAPERHGETEVVAQPAPQPTLRIGQIEVIVAAPEAPQRSRSEPAASSSSASRSYRRSL